MPRKAHPDGLSRRDFEYLWTCAAVGATVELISTKIRHLQRTEVAEVAEGFRKRAKGQLGHAP